MDITLRTPLSFSEIGKKENQEDRLYPSSGASPSTRTFILCDGMGGHARGEVAAEVVSATLGSSLDGDSSPEVSASGFEAALSGCYKALDEKLPGDDNRRPGTTLTCLRIGSNGVLAAHIGDSRIYQVRPGAGIMFRTEDHSLVNELVRAGQITEAEARVHPRRNVITRAMMPGASNPPKADVAILTDVRAGDFFFICCDGVLEKLQEDRLIKILSNSATNDSAKLSAIKAICDTGTRDNYTAWLIPVADVTGNDTHEGRPVITLSNVAPARPNSPAAKAAPAKNAGKRGIVLGIFILCIIVAALIIMLRGSKDESPAADAPKIENKKPVEEQEPAATSKPQDDTERQRDAVRKTRDTRPAAPKPETSAPERNNAPKEDVPATPDARQGAAANAAAAAASNRRKTETTPAPATEEPEKKTEPAKTEPKPDSDPEPISE